MGRREVVLDGDVVVLRCAVMTKPHEEKWTAHKDCVVMVDGWRTVFVSHEDMGPEPSRERAQLAAQAPAMARLLLRVHDVAATTEGCPICKDIFGPHRGDCELVAVLRAAGVLP